ncbi:YsnF/AvaK domain-containing protein [Massilia timonae]|uniref:YsnF/AvaK domain-containing protein n=1 Tax=Massilia timonae TaxID=47229 RepID=UPI0028A16694|nr:DUF2382 domain-containing protein [Massilia timonae]
MQHTLVAVFDNHASAQSALDELLASGFSRQDVRLSGGANSAGTTAGTATTTDADGDTGIGNSIKNFFGNLFGDDDDASRMNRYEGAVSSGKHIVTMSADSLSEVERAADIVERFGPVDIDEHSDGVGHATSAGAMMAGSQSGMQSYSTSTQPASMANQGVSVGASIQRDAETQTIPVVQEELKIGKREVQRGGARIYSRVVETPVNESIGLREEHVDVQRRVVNQPINPSDVAAFKEQTIEMRETAEEAVVQKSSRIVEEVTIGKQVSERQEQIHDTVRHTEVEVERLDGATADDDSYYRSHFQNNYAAGGDAYDDYSPAYAYGSQMRGQYAGRQWDDVETDLRSDWETRNSGSVSTWEKMKAAVRHGWDRMTNDTSARRS